MRPSSNSENSKMTIVARTDPSWQLLYLENPGFARNLPGSAKLALLREALDNEFDNAVEAIVGIDLAVKAFDVESFTWKEGSQLEHIFEIWPFQVTCYCYDTDADLEDLEELTEIPLATALVAYVNYRNQNLQTVLHKLDIDYEHCISPRNGYPMRPGGIKIESSSDYWEFESESWPDDTRLISKLVKVGEAILLKESDTDRIDSRPLFSNGPEWNEDNSMEGSIGLTWNAECFLPAGLDPASKYQRYTKSRISLEETFAGNSVFDDYTIEYVYKTPADLESILIAALEEEKVSRRLEKPILQILGLQSRNDG